MRQPKLWYRKFNDTWYVQVGDRQIALAKGREAKDEAVRRYHQLMAQPDVAQVADEARINVASLCDTFLDWSQKHNSESSYRWYRGFLQEFCNLYGGQPVASLKSFHITRWLDSRDWSQSSRRAAITHYGIGWAIPACGPDPKTAAAIGGGGMVSEAASQPPDGDRGNASGART